MDGEMHSCGTLCEFWDVMYVNPLIPVLQVSAVLQLKVSRVSSCFVSSWLKQFLYAMVYICFSDGRVKLNNKSHLFSPP